VNLEEKKMQQEISRQTSPSQNKDETFRLYRGIKEKYRPDKINFKDGTDFTDCPFRATLYARGRSGCLIIVDVPTDQFKLLFSEQCYEHEKDAPKRYMTFKKFDSFIVGIIPITEVRARLREEIRGQRGLLCDYDKDQALKRIIDRAIKKSLSEDSLPVYSLLCSWPIYQGKDYPH
jgi:hypothetical protein